MPHELKAAADRGEPDDGSRYYEHWLAALERLVTAKGLTDSPAFAARKEAWTEAYRNTPHGRPVELPKHQRCLTAGGCSLGSPLRRQLWADSGDRTRRSADRRRGSLASAGLGTLLGMRHALEPDHLAALSTLLTGERNVRKAAWLGVYWGLVIR